MHVRHIHYPRRKRCPAVGLPADCQGAGGTTNTGMSYTVGSPTKLVVTKVRSIDSPVAQLTKGGGSLLAGGNVAAVIGCETHRLSARRRRNKLMQGEK